MTPTTTVPVTRTEEAAVYLRSLDLQSEFELLVDYAKQFVPGLVKIHARLQPAYDLGGPEVVLVEAWMQERHLELDTTQWGWNEWFIKTIPEEASRYLVPLIFTEEPDAG